MNRNRNYTAEEVAAIIMGSDNEEEVFDVAENEEISDEEIDNVEFEALEDDSDVSNVSDDSHVSSDSDGISDTSNASDLESDYDAAEVIYTGKDGTKWRSTPPSAAVYRRHNIIHVHPGLTNGVAQLEDQLDFSLALFTSSMIRYICECTNKRLPDDKPEITEDQLLSYIGVLLILGVTKKRNVDISEIWSPNSTHYLDYVTLTMSRTHFQTISRYITFDDVDTRTREDSKFHKMQHIFSQFQKTYVMLWNPTPITALMRLCMHSETSAHFNNTCTANQQSMVSNIFAYVMLKLLTSVMYRFMWEKKFNKVHKIKTLG